MGQECFFSEQVEFCINRPHLNFIFKYLTTDIIFNKNNIKVKKKTSIGSKRLLREDGAKENKYRSFEIICLATNCLYVQYYYFKTKGNVHHEKINTIIFKY